MGTEKYKNCDHQLDEIKRAHNGSTIEFRYRCKKCGMQSVEKYEFSEGHELDEDGNIIGDFQIL